LPEIQITNILCEHQQTREAMGHWSPEQNKCWMFGRSISRNHQILDEWRRRYRDTSYCKNRTGGKNNNRKRREL